MQLGLERGTPVSATQVAAALKSARRLSRLTEELLDLKRLDEGLFSLHLAPVDLAAVAQETAASMGTSATPVRVSGEAGLVAVVDQERVRQALENLVANAIKYSRGKPVEVRLATGHFSGMECGVLEVLDSGPGISPEVASTLFHRFSFSSDSKGLGLGLHLAHRIARIHCGELTVHSRQGGGTRFRLTLPLHPPEETN
jgi:two-component system OmpR family sensor kinase